MTAAAPARRFFIPEVVQTSAMDCGPAALKSLLEGFGVSVNYGRLREACQTEVDGTSIDTLEDIARRLGLDAEQVLLPPDHLLVDEARALPAIVIVTLPNGFTHFVVAWRRVGPWLQVMDPGSGRQWLTEHRFLSSLFMHTYPVPAAGWREWAGSEDFLAPLRRRLQSLAVEGSNIDALLQPALDDSSWQSLAALDAATRLATALLKAGAADRGTEALGVVERFFEHDRTLPPGERPMIPRVYWFVTPARPQPGDPGPMLEMRGAVLVRVLGRAAAAAPEAPEMEAGTGGVETGLSAAAPDAAPTAGETVPPRPGSALDAVLAAPPERPEVALWQALREDGLLTPGAVCCAVALAVVGMATQFVLLQGLLRVGQQAGLAPFRLNLLATLVTLVGLLFLIELPIATMTNRVGRHLEARLRAAFLAKMPRLSNQYFHSRLTSDMVQRAYDLRLLGRLPELGATILRQFIQILLTTAGLIWLKPDAALLALLATAAFTALSVVTNPILKESDLRVRSHNAALSRFYLDAMLGLSPLRTHNGARAFRREHESLLVEWARARRDFNYVSLAVQGCGALVYVAFAVWMVAGLTPESGGSSGLLLLFWTLTLPMLSQSLVQAVDQYPAIRNLVLRLLEPLGAPDEDAGEESQPSPEPETAEALATARPALPGGMAVELRDVAVLAGGSAILQGVRLRFEPGAHVAVVGPSGAGKSTLVRVLLGLHQPATGVCLIDGEPLTGRRIHAARRQTAWVDPAVQLWNRSLLENLLYGNLRNERWDQGLALEPADLLSVLERLPSGLQTPLGEAGALVSGGEGQRVRLARAMNRQGVRLAILDEPFRGLDRERRCDLLARARDYWRDATLLCVTHDVGETLAFPRVLVVEGGRIVEDGAPAELAAGPGSRYRALLDAEEAVRTGLWEGADWRRVRVEDGRVTETGVAGV